MHRADAIVRERSHSSESLLVTVLEPEIRSQVNIASAGVFEAVHAASIPEAVRAARDRRVTSVLISPAVVQDDELHLVSKLARDFPGAVVLAQTQESGLGCPQHILALGHCGIREIVDLSARRGWDRVRELAIEAYPNVRRELRARVLPSLGGATAEAVHFFELLFREAPRVSTVRQLAPALGVLPSTLMSRFFRHKLPSPKCYLARVRLLYASALLELAGVSIAEVANRLDYSSSQSFGRHIRMLFRMSASDFRWRYSFERAVLEFKDQLVEPHNAKFASFNPFANGVRQRTSHRRVAKASDVSLSS